MLNFKQVNRRFLTRLMPRRIGDWAMDGLPVEREEIVNDRATIRSRRLASGSRCTKPASPSVGRCPFPSSRVGAEPLRDDLGQAAILSSSRTRIAIDRRPNRIPDGGMGGLQGGRPTQRPLAAFCRPARRFRASVVLDAQPRLLTGGLRALVIGGWADVSPDAGLRLIDFDDRDYIFANRKVSDGRTFKEICKRSRKATCRTGIR